MTVFLRTTWRDDRIGVESQLLIEQRYNSDFPGLTMGGCYIPILQGGHDDVKRLCNKIQRLDNRQMQIFYSRLSLDKEARNVFWLERQVDEISPPSPSSWERWLSIRLIP